MVSKAEKERCILAVDDHPKVLRFLEIGLKLHGFKVIATTSGEEALELVKSARPDVMLLDMLMPGMDGFEVLRRLRVSTQLPVIACSASLETQFDAMRLGASCFMAKPFQLNEIVGKIEELLKS